MANLFQVVDWLAMESLRSLLNKLAIVSKFNTDYNKEFTREFAVGETVRIKLPQRFTIRQNLQYSAQPINRIYTTVNCDQIFGVDFEWDSAEAALQLERGKEIIKREYLDKAMEQLANEWDSRAALWALTNTNNVVGALGTTPTAMQTYALARQRLIENSCTPGAKNMIVTPNMMTTLVSNTNTIFNPSDAIGKAFREGYYGRAASFDWEESMNLWPATAGVRAGAVTVKTANQSGSLLAITATAGDTFLAGEPFTIALVNNANPVNRRSTGSLKDFVIMAPLTAVGAGNAADVLQISPAINGPLSQYQNVDALPAAAAALTFWPGTTTPNGKVGAQGLALSRDAYAFVSVKLETPKACELSFQQRDPVSGVTVRFVRMFDPQTSKMVNRFDCMGGFGNLYPDNCAVRVLSLA